MEILLILATLFECICLPAIFAGWRLTTVTLLWLFLSAVFSGIYFAHLRPFLIPKRKRERTAGIRMFAELDAAEALLGTVLIVIIALQISCFLFGMHLDADDAMYLGNATTALSTDTLFRFDPYTGNAVALSQVRDYVLSPLSIFYASVGMIFDVSPVILAHTVMPPVLILLAYAVYALLAGRLFKGRKEQLLFLLFLSLFHAMSFVSTRTLGAVLLLRIWQGKAIVCSILLPLLYVWFLDFEKGKNVWFLTFVTMCTACLCSFTGVVLSLLLLLCYCVVFALRKRGFKKAFFYALAGAPNLALILLYLLLVFVG